ncbi:MAG: CusA/CzcA family heavy metal efflux RND transporter [Planctomycetes bacterium]|nr:CusA/CzcA family heavy metal efflux RND transporter [Planctomycetota bacterium]
MIERLMHLALHNRLLILLLVVLIVGLGALAFRTLPIDAFPDVTNIQVEVVSTAPGLSPLEIEKFVTYPIEMAMRGLPKLRLMRSITKYGLSVVTLVFHDDVDVYFARQLVFERLAAVTEKLPEGVSTEMGPVATAMGEIYQYTLEGKPPADPQERIMYFTDLRTLQDWVIAPLLKNVPGVSEINSFGGYLKQFQVIVDPDKLLSYGLSVKQVFEAIRNNNQNVGGNIVSQASEQYIVRGVGLIRSEEDIGNIVLAVQDGAPVFLNHVARIEVGHAVRQGSALKNGEGEAVGGIVMMLKGENSLEVVHRVQEKVREINHGTVLPASLKIVPFYERSEIVGQSIRTVVWALAEGSLLVLVVLYLLLRSVRGALIVIFALPLSLLLTVIVMKYAGLYANLMSLGGLAISIGMIIDATIIQVENVQRHLGAMTEKSHKLATVLKAVLEVRKPSIFGELIIALIFIPIISLQGMEGKMFSPLAYAVAIALFASLFLSILVIPVLCALVLRHGHEKESLVVRAVRRMYGPLLCWSLRHRASTVVIAVLFVAVALALVPHLGTEFVPIMDEGAFDMDVQMLPGISLENATEITDRIEKKLKQFPELKTVLSRTGQTGLALEARGVDKTGFVGDLEPRSQWTSARTRDELFGKMRDAVAVIPGIAFSFSQPIQCRIDEMVAGTRAQVIVKVFGDDTDILQQKMAEIAKVIAPIAGVADLVTEVVAGQPYIAIQIDRNRIARYGINVNDVLSVVEIAVGGKPASQVYEENRFFDLTVRFPEEKRNSVEAIGNILVDAPAGTRVPLKQLADISVVDGPVQISRENGQRRMGIEFNIKGRDMGSVVREAQEQIARKVALPSGYYLAWGGQFENQQQAMKRLALILPMVVGLILLLLFITFNSIRLALLVIFNLPFALVGGVFSLLISGLYLSVPASVGFIVLFGVAVLNGVVLVSYVTQLRREGMPLQQAISTGCGARLRPILMTASITVFSLIPMLMATGPGSEVQRPLAAVVVGGLFTSTLATLLVLPTLYGWFERAKMEPEF